MGLVYPVKGQPCGSDNDGTRTPQMLTPFDIIILRTHAAMVHNAALIADIEALLAAAKSYDCIDLSADRRARLDLLVRVEALHYQLDNPADAMFRQIMNVRYLSYPPLS
jgi:hypothetical protein